MTDTTKPARPRNVSPDAALLRRAKVLLGWNETRLGAFLDITRELAAAYLQGRARFYLSETEREALVSELKKRRNEIAALEMEI